MKKYLQRMAQALEALIPQSCDISALKTSHWAYGFHHARAVMVMPHVRAHPSKLLLSLDMQKEILIDNTLRFARGYAANNALLWGARGVGKSALIKAACAQVHAQFPGLCLLEIPRDRLADLPDLLIQLQSCSRRVIIFCDDLSFEPDDDAYKSLKSVLDGSTIEAAGNVIFYATSNRRHLMTREVSENELDRVLNRNELADERLSLTDRFGLWLGFHRMDQGQYLAIIAAYAEHFQLPWNADDAADSAEAKLWSRQRGGVSGRVAWQYIMHIAGRAGRAI